MNLNINILKCSLIPLPFFITKCEPLLTCKYQVSSPLKRFQSFPEMRCLSAVSPGLPCLLLYSRALTHPLAPELETRKRVTQKKVLPYRTWHWHKCWLYCLDKIPSTDMRLLLLVNSNTASSWYCRVTPSSEMTTESLVRDRKTQPSSLAAPTRAPSSGDAAW